jgi:hypothetical protein
MMDERLQNLSNIETRLQEQRLTPRAGISAAPQVVSQVALAAPATPDKLPATTSAAMAQARSPEENSKSEQTTMVASAQLDATHPGRNYVDLTPAELMAQIAAVNGTSAQKAAVARLYVGKWMRVEGVTRDVMVPADRRWAIVYFQGYERLTGGALVLGFDATWVDRVEHQPLEGRLIVHGQIGSAEDREVRLERCELGD